MKQSTYMSQLLLDTFKRKYTIYGSIKITKIKANNDFLGRNGSCLRAT